MSSSPSPSGPPVGGARSVGGPAGAAATLILGCALLALALGCAWLLVSREYPPPRPPSATEPRVRIALVERAPELALLLEGPWRAVPDEGREALLEDVGPVTVRMVGARAGLSLEHASAALGFPGARSLELRPAGPDAAPFELDGRRYRGLVRALYLDEGALQLVNAVGIEDYLAGVLPHEMPIRWSEAALQAQAIAARTYALTNLHPRRAYDLLADTRSQVYRGIIAEDERARRIVDSTRGLVASYQGEMFVTYFHSTCGGDTVPAGWIFPWVKVEATPPALMGATGCRCQASRLYRWTQDVSDLAPHAKKLGLSLPLQAVRVEHWPRGQYVKTVTFTGAGGEEKTVSGWNMRSQFGLKNYAFDVALAGGGAALHFEGRGWGHGVGMCQFGAEGFSTQEGWDAVRIVEHFYPGAKVEALGY